MKTKYKKELKDVNLWFKNSLSEGNTLMEKGDHWRGLAFYLEVYNRLEKFFEKIKYVPYDNWEDVEKELK